MVTDEGVRLEPPSSAKRLHEANAGYLLLDELVRSTSGTAPIRGCLPPAPSAEE